MGEQVYIVGNHESLGAWNNHKAILMKTDSNKYPEWTSVHEIEINNIEEAKEIEYKYLIQSNGRLSTRWETFKANRKLDLSAYFGGHRQKWTMKVQVIDGIFN